MLTKPDQPQQREQCQQRFLDLFEDMRKTRASLNRDKTALVVFGRKPLSSRFFIRDMQTAHNGYAVYCLAKMLQRSYLYSNGNKPPCHVANTRPVSPP